MVHTAANWSDTCSTIRLNGVECPAPTRLLVIEDSPSDAMLLEAALRDSVLEPATIVCEPCLGAGLQRLAEGTFDGVLIDLGLPDSEGLETFCAFGRQRVRRQSSSSPAATTRGWPSGLLSWETAEQG
jgi:CheY-like chemotaxis protein